MNEDDMKAITLRPLPGSPWLTDDSTGWSSRVNLPMPAVLVKAVRLNGKALDYLPATATSIVVWPKVPREGGRLEISYREAHSEGHSGPRSHDQDRVASTLAKHRMGPPVASYGLTPAQP